MPLARLLIATSRLRPGMDGGYTIATMQRARMLAQAGYPVTLLTVDLHPDNTSDIEGFRRAGLADERTAIRNLLQEVRQRPELLRTAALRAPEPGTLRDAPVDRNFDPVELDSAGRPWRQLVRDAAGAVAHTDLFDAQGRRLFRLPYLQRADWWRTEESIAVFDELGERVGGLAGFRGLYRAWWSDVVREARDAEPRLPVVAIAEARQVGELLAGIPGLPVIHTVHSAHTLPPHAWDSPIDAVWQGWLETLPHYDAVVWLTARQRADVARRRGGEEAPGWVIPHPALVPDDIADALEAPSGSARLAIRDPLRAIAIARLAPVKRLDQLIDAWARVVSVRPGARLDMYGEGPQRAALQERIDALGLSRSVTLHGHRDGAAEEARTAAVSVLTSDYEGQSLVVAESLARGCPVVAYDIAYGPAEMIDDGISGRLVPSGDVAALADAIAEHLGDPALLARRSRAALDWARSSGPDRAVERWRALIDAVSAAPPRSPSAEAASRP